jgi:hypothetical protein
VVLGTWRLVFYHKRKSIPFPDSFKVTIMTPPDARSATYSVVSKCQCMV